MTKKPVSIARKLGQAVSDIANATSVAATGSEIGVLELAIEDELNPPPSKRARRVKPTSKKRIAAKKLKKTSGKKRISTKRSR